MKNIFVLLATLHLSSMAYCIETNTANASCFSDSDRQLILSMLMSRSVTPVRVPNEGTNTPLHIFGARRSNFLISYMHTKWIGAREWPAAEQTLTLPLPVVLKNRLINAGFGDFCEKTNIDMYLGGQKLSTHTVKNIIASRIDAYRELIKTNSPATTLPTTPSELCTINILNIILNMNR